MCHVTAFALLVSVDVQLGIFSRLQNQGVAGEVEALWFHDHVDAVFRGIVLKRDASLDATVVGAEANRVGVGL